MTLINFYRALESVYIKDDFNFTNFLINIVMRCSMKGAYHCCFCKVVWHSYFQKFLLINFTCTCSNWLINFSFTHFLLIKGYGKYSQWKELVIAPFIEWFKTVRESSSWILLVLRAICSTISFSLPLIDRTDCQQCALLKEPVTAPFTEQFKIDENINYNRNYIIHIIVPWWKEQWSTPFIQHPVQILLQAKHLQKSMFLREYSVVLQKSLSKTFSK